MDFEDTPELAQFRSEVRSWLEANADRPEGIWLITYNKGSGKPFPTYDEIIEEALCFGWIDSTYRSLDDGQSWEALDLPYLGSMWGALKLDENCVLFFGLRGHALQSCDFGDNWTELDGKAYACDVTDPKAIKRAFAQVREDLGDVDVPARIADAGLLVESPTSFLGGVRWHHAPRASDRPSSAAASI